MSFCIKSITNSSRYVPTFVVTAQECAVRRFSSRQSPKQVKSIASSTFLNEFLGSVVPLSSSFESSYKLSTALREPVNNVDTLSTSLHDNRLFDGCKLSNISNENSSQQITNNVNYKLHKENSQYSFIDSVRNQLVYSNNSSTTVNQVEIANQEKTWVSSNHKINFVSEYAKDKTKDRFTTAQKLAVALKEKSTNASPVNRSNVNKNDHNEQLEHVYKTLTLDLPAFFVKSIDYKIYHPEIEFVNNVRGTTTKGIYYYVKQMALLRIIGHLKYAYVKLDVLKITMHTQDNTVRVRWRINGITGMRVLLSFWKFKVWKIRESLKDAETWHDGYSTFYVGDDGLVFKHVAEKMMPDQSVDGVKPKSDIPSKLASQLTFSEINLK